MPINYLLLIQLITIHLVGDYVLQPDSWVKDKKLRKWKSYRLYVHALVHGLLAWFVVFNIYAWWIGLTVFITHLLIDRWKVSQQNETYQLFLIDQAFHLFILFICWVVYTQQFNMLVDKFQFYILVRNIWLVTVALILLFKPSSLFIGIFVSKWALPTNGLDEAGKYIGYLERFLTFIFILAGMYQAIGFLVAAKSILRLGNGQISPDRKETEYVLIGTFISFLIATVIGVAIKHFIR